MSHFKPSSDFAPHTPSSYSSSYSDHPPYSDSSSYSDPHPYRLQPNENLDVFLAQMKYMLEQLRLDSNDQQQIHNTLEEPETIFHMDP